MDLTQLSSQPISADSPAGVDVRQDQAFEALQAEVDKLASPAAAGPVHWDQVQRLAEEILAQKSKDLVVASYLAVALTHTAGSHGCIAGVTLLRELLEHFWEELYPLKSRLRARVRALEWSTEKTLAALTQQGGLTWSAEELRQLSGELSRLERFLVDHLEQPPSLVSLTDYLNGLGAAQEPAEAAPPMSPARRAASEDAAQAESSSRHESPKPGDAGRIPGEHHAADTRRVLRDDELGTGQVPRKHDEVEPLRGGEDGVSIEGALQILAAKAFDLWQQDLSDPHPYRLTRQAVWSQVEKLPPAEGGRTRIAPPPSQVANLLQELRSSGDAESLLKMAETKQSQYIFWLDLGYFISDALFRLGERFEGARRAVTQETSFLLHRFPDLQELSFSDGRPFAAPETRQWLRDIARAPAAPGLATASLPTVSLPEGPQTEADQGSGGEQFEEFEQLLGQGKLLEALEQSQLMLRGKASGRECLVCRLAICQSLLAAGNCGLALPYLEQALDEIDRHHLNQYEPALALRGLKLAWHAHQQQQEASLKEKATLLLARIGRLDLPEMARLAHK